MHPHSRLRLDTLHSLGTSSSFLALPVTNTIFFPTKEAAMLTPLVGAGPLPVGAELLPVWTEGADLASGPGCQG